MDDELERLWKEAAVAYFKINFINSLEGPQSE
jgi:hypothetical protein